MFVTVRVEKNTLVKVVLGLVSSGDLNFENKEVWKDPIF